MNKKIVFIVIALILLLGGGYYMSLKNNQSKATSSGSISETKDVFTSIKDAMSKKMTLVCEFKDETGISTKSYIKNGAVRVTTNNEASENKSGDIIIKDKKMYMWDIKTKQGFVYDIPDEEGEKGVGSTDETSQSENYLNMIDKYKDSCKVAAVEDSYFTPPTDINFQDMSKLLEDLKKQTPQLPQGY